MRVLFAFLVGFLIGTSNSFESGSGKFTSDFEKTYEFSGTVFVTSAANKCLCITRDSSGSNKSLRMILENYCESRQKSRWNRNWSPKLEIVKIAKTEEYQLSQGYRGSGKPYGLAGCLTPSNSGVFGNDCKSSDSLWYFLTISDGRVQFVHKNTGKCIRADNDKIVMKNCDRNDIKQQWDIKIEKD